MNTEDPTAQQAAPASLEATADTAMDEPQPEIRDTAIFLGGIDDLKQRQIEEFVTHYTAHEFAIEWIDDNSLVLVFDSAGVASDALAALQDEVPAEQLEAASSPLFLRSSKPHPSVLCNFQLRYATFADKKLANAKELSKFYLKNGAPSQKFNRKRFGTARSEPMKYGGKDLINRDKVSKRTGDLFPHLNEGGDDDLFPHLKGRQSAKDDLFPHLVNGGVKKNRNRKKKSTKEDDLFPLKTESVYSKMDY